MKTLDIKKVYETQNQKLLIGEEVKTISYDRIGGYYKTGDNVKVENVIGSYLQVVNKKRYSFLIYNKRVELINEIKLPYHCISCNTLYKNSHKITCVKNNIDRMLEENKLEETTK